MKGKIIVFVGLMIVVALVSVNLLHAQELDSEGKLNGKMSFFLKCGKCHTLERPLSKIKTADQWKKTVENMHKKAHGWMDEKQVVDIAYFLSSKSLYDTKCSGCHSKDRALDIVKDKEGWTKTVKRMQAKESSGISDSEADQIILYLFTVEGGYTVPTE